MAPARSHPRTIGEINRICMPPTLQYQGPAANQNRPRPASGTGHESVHAGGFMPARVAS